MRFCSDCGKEIALRELDTTETIDNRLYCSACTRKVYEEDFLMVRDF